MLIGEMPGTLFRERTKKETFSKLSILKGKKMLWVLKKRLDGTNLLSTQNICFNL